MKYKEPPRKQASAQKRYRYGGYHRGDKFRSYRMTESR
jgi:hypothetical protein